MSIENLEKIRKYPLSPEMESIIADLDTKNLNSLAQTRSNFLKAISDDNNPFAFTERVTKMVAQDYLTHNEAVDTRKELASKIVGLDIRKSAAYVHDLRVKDMLSEYIWTQTVLSKMHPRDSVTLYRCAKDVEVPVRKGISNWTTDKDEAERMFLKEDFEAMLIRAKVPVANVITAYCTNEGFDEYLFEKEYWVVTFEDAAIPFEVLEEKVLKKFNTGPFPSQVEGQVKVMFSEPLPDSDLQIVTRVGDDGDATHTSIGYINQFGQEVLFTPWDKDKAKTLEIYYAAKPGIDRLFENVKTKHINDMSEFKYIDEGIEARIPFRSREYLVELGAKIGDPYKVIWEDNIGRGTFEAAILALQEGHHVINTDESMNDKYPPVERVHHVSEEDAESAAYSMLEMSDDGKGVVIVSKLE